MLRQRYIFLFCAALFLFAGCGIFKHGKSDSLSHEEKIENTAEYIDGCKDKIAGEYEKALVHFSACAKADKKNPAPLYEIAQILFGLNKAEAALPYINKACELDADNQWYLLLKAEILATMKKYKEAAVYYKKLAESHPENAEYLMGWAAAEIYAQQYGNAIEAYNKLEAKFGVTEDISLLKEKAYLLQNKFFKAVEEIQKLINAYPSEIAYKNYLADLYMANDMYDEAKKIYDEILKQDTANGEVHFSLAEYYRLKGSNSKSFEELKRAFSSAQVDIDTKIKILLSYYTLTEKSDSLKKQAYTLCDLLIATHPSEAKGYSMYADFLVRDNKVTEAKEQYLKVIALDSSRYAVWEQLLNIESVLKNYAALAGESSRAIDLFPEQVALYLMNGAANVMLKKYDEAIDVLKKGVDLAIFDQELLKDFYTYLGDAYHAKQLHKESYGYYDKVLEIDPANAYVLNNYSYYLALQNTDLDKAEKMASKAVSAEPSNASYLDTYAWVLFKLQRYTEAEKNLKTALETAGETNAVILEHYGDVQFKLGNTVKALEYWKKAKSVGTASDLLEKKIADGTYYE